MTELPDIPETSSEIVTPADVNRIHLWLIRQLKDGVTLIAAADERVTAAKEAFEKAGVRVRQQAREQARESGHRITVGELDDLTFQETEQERLTLEMAEQHLRIMKMRQSTLKSQVESAESMGHNLRAEMRLSGAS